MKKDASKRVLIRIRIGEDVLWICLCSIHKDIYNAFMQATNTRPKQIKTWIKRWTEEDFNWVIDYSEPNHLRLLNELIIDRYKRIHPHMYYNNVVHESRLVRSWISEKMGKEIRKHDKPTYNRLFNSASDSSSGL